MTDAQDTSGRVGLVGKTLGRYRVSAELGRGGMATVYRAYDPELARDVAVKVIHGAFTGRGDIERRFRREAQAVAGLKHEGIVAVFDFAPGGDGEPAYIVSELVNGPSLRQLLADVGGRLLPEIATIVGARVAGALAAAHGRGIVHRDVKPDNVMIDAGGGDTKAVRVLLTDFGIARMIEDDTLTATGSILGSPAYMSPEQAKGGNIGPPSDVFSLGVLLYQLATGRMPFAGKEPLAVIAAILTGEFLRPGQVDARVGPELEAVILRCLRRAPEERYSDGGALEAALRAVAEKGSLAPLVQEGPALRRFLDDREALAREVGAAVAEEAVTSARACLRRGELTRSLAHINRALAYVPGHGAAQTLLARISARRRWLKVAAIGAAALAVAGAGFVTARALRGRPGPATVAAATAKPATPTAAIPAPVAAVVTVPATVPVRTETPPSTAVARRTERAASRRRDQPAGAPVVTAAALVKTEPATPPVAAVDPAPPPPPPPVAHEPVPAPTAGLTLRASYGFCAPSLDERPAAVRPVYDSIPAGLHRIYCTLPGGERALVATYDLRPGTHPDLVVVPGADGKPRLGRGQE